MEAEKLALAIDDGGRRSSCSGLYYAHPIPVVLAALPTFQPHATHALRSFPSAMRSPTSAMRCSPVSCDRASTMLVQIWSYRDIFDASWHASR